MHDDDYDGSAGPFHPVFVFLGALAGGCVVVMGLLALWAMISPAAAQGQMPCVPFDALRSSLAENYEEQPASMGLMTGGAAFVQLFRTVDGSSWTLVVVDVNGMACALGVGTDWFDNEVKDKGIEG